MAQSIYAQIKPVDSVETITNVITLTTGDSTAPFADGYDYVNEITSLIPMPAIGWTYDGSTKTYTNPASAPTPDSLIDSNSGFVAIKSIITGRATDLGPSDLIYQMPKGVGPGLYLVHVYIVVTTSGGSPGNKIFGYVTYQNDSCSGAVTKTAQLFSLAGSGASGALTSGDSVKASYVIQSIDNSAISITTTCEDYKGAKYNIYTTANKTL